jgi:hypothetical protein
MRDFVFCQSASLRYDHAIYHRVKNIRFWNLLAEHKFDFDLILDEKSWSDSSLLKSAFKGIRGLTG